jgi:gliding motility associated protien GldN
MRARVLLIIGILFAGGVGSLFSQETARERIEQRRQNETRQQQAGTTTWSVPGSNHVDESLENAKWSRVIYRYLDLTREANAPLYYPVTPIEGKSSLFTLIFHLFQEERIPVYEYLDGQEVFTDEYRLDFSDFIDRFGIYHETDGEEIVVNDADIPGNEVLGYFVKEAYYIEPATSSFKVRPLAICPVLHRADNYATEPTRYPLFWIPYSAFEPHARRMPVMASSLNNSMSGSVDDFFRLRKYEGEIYKAHNPRNLSISQYTSTPEEAQAERDRIEQELINFEKQLWKGTSPSARQDNPRVSRRGRQQPVRSAATTSSVTMRDRRY